MLSLAFSPLSFSPPATTVDSLESVAPSLAAMVARSMTDPLNLAAELRASPIAALAPELGDLQPASKASSRPVVVAHGMGDSCFNPGMKQITKMAGDRLGVYSACIPTGDNKIMDTINGFLMNMDKSVDVFAEKVKKDPKLANGFNAFGLSQGNNIIRGYIQKYNDPPVHGFISINGINAGTTGFPNCPPSHSSGVCVVLSEILGGAANNELVQAVNFQANMFRDPQYMKTAAYHKHNKLAAWNGETGADMSAAKANWAKTSKFVWVVGTLDTMVFPKEEEQWGQISDNFPKDQTITPMKQSSWYTTDAFGLKTADEAGKVHFEQFVGGHLGFKEADLQKWLDAYFSD